MDDEKKEKMAEICLAEEERQPCEIWTRKLS